MIVGRALHFVSFTLRHHRGVYRLFHTGYLCAQEARQELRRWRRQQPRPPECESVVPVWPVTRGPRQHFFGYYDKCPWDESDRRLLALEAPAILRTPGPGDEATVGWVEPARGTEFHAVAKTRAWNWQQGCMLQWFGTPAGDEVFYNDYRKDGYVGVICSLNAPGKERVLERPLYALAPDGRIGASVDFERLHRGKSGYGYSARRRAVDARHFSDDDGIWIVDLETGRSRLLLSLAQIAQLSPRPCMFGAEHYLNHVEFSPGGQRLCFLHRWHIRGKYYTRLYTIRPDGTELQCLADNDLVSHHTWLDDRQLLVWAQQSGSGDAFYLFDTSAPATVSTLVGERVLTQDGHPSFSPDRRFLLVDTYPDEDRRQHLLLLDLASGTKVELGQFREPMRFNDDIRCDLHPRWNRSGTMICFDSAHGGWRQIYVVDLREWLHVQEWQCEGF